MKNIFLSFLFLISSSNLIFGQGGVSISGDNSLPDDSAILDVKSTTQGFLPPRMTVTQKDNISAPAAGLMVYQTDGIAGVYSFDGSAWVYLGSTWSQSGDDVSLNPAGSIGIGTATPDGAKLNVVGTGAVANTQTIEYRFYTQDILGNFSGEDVSINGVGPAPASDGSAGEVTVTVPTIVGTNAISVSITVNVGGDLAGFKPFVATSSGAVPMVFAGPTSGDVSTATTIANPATPISYTSICGNPNNGGTFVATDVVAQDITAIVGGLTSYKLYGEDAGSSGGTGLVYCGSKSLWFEFVLTYTVPIIEPAIAAENGTIQLTDFAGNDNTGLYVDNQGDIQMVTGDGPLMVRNPDGNFVMQNYIEQPITIGNKPWVVTNPTYLSVFVQAILEVSGGTQRPLYGGNIREYDSLGMTRIHPNGYIDVYDRFSIHADYNIAGGNFFAHSDARIKNVIGISRGEEDLDILNTIKVTDYKYIDTLSKGNKMVKKVIAQELRETYPEAVTLTSRVIPSIYQHSAIVDGWINLAADVKVGEPLEYYTTEGEVETRHTNVVVAVEEGRFRIAGEIDEESAFIYGKMVNDFHVVDYDALTTLNVSATQALLERVEALEAENEALKKQAEEVAAIKDQLDQLKQLLEMTVSTTK